MWQKDSWGGGEKWMLTTASGLRKRQHQIHFCGRTNSLFLKRGAENQFQTLPLDIKGDFSLPTIIKLAGYYKEHTIAAVIANFNKDVRLGGLAGKISGHPLLVARN
nr:glycosyltransferase [Candidatus Saccharibacteria bacterium]NIV04163.1 glycosyltransferase [Calditrichia bacterium]NIV72426.1 glycosyltransferase [Calditrichia bacterium]NIV99742.1 glycosyltransferase [Candidatus Saccharibacteria bacterium]NIW79798.1 glycosyltransferase [Calditrichia bacterium]